MKATSVYLKKNPNFWSSFTLKKFLRDNIHIFSFFVAIPGCFLLSSDAQENIFGNLTPLVLVSVAISSIALCTLRHREYSYIDSLDSQVKKLDEILYDSNSIVKHGRDNKENIKVVKKNIENEKNKSKNFSVTYNIWEISLSLLGINMIKAENFSARNLVGFLIISLSRIFIGPALAKIIDGNQLAKCDSKNQKIIEIKKQVNDIINQNLPNYNRSEAIE